MNRNYSNPYVMLLMIALTIPCWNAGCNSKPEWHSELVPAVGSVTINSEIPVGAIINLHPLNGDVDKRASRPAALVAEDGTYTLTTYEYGDGAPPGAYTFTIMWPQDPKLGGLSPDRLGSVYSTPTSSRLVVDIPEDGSRIEPVVIENAKINMRTSKKLQPLGPGLGK